MKSILALLITIGSLSVHAFQVECTLKNAFEVPLKAHDERYTTVIDGPGRFKIEISKDLVLLVGAIEYQGNPNEIYIQMVIARTDIAWQPLASASGINYLNLNLNSNSLSTSFYDHELAQVLEGGKKKRTKALKDLIEKKDSIRREFTQKYNSEIIGFNCRAKDQRD